MGKNVLKEDSAARGQYIASRNPLRRFLSVSIKLFFKKNPNPKNILHTAYTSISSAEKA